MWLSACLNSHKVPLDSISVFMRWLTGKYWTGQVWSRQVNTWVKFDNKKQRRNPAKTWLDWSDRWAQSQTFGFINRCMCLHSNKRSSPQAWIMLAASGFGAALLPQDLAGSPTLGKQKHKVGGDASGVHWLNLSKINTFFSPKFRPKKCCRGSTAFLGWRGVVGQMVRNSSPKVVRIILYNSHSDTNTF